MLRRYQINAESELKLGNLTLNQPYMEISVDAKTINLPNKEFQLLFLLVSIQNTFLLEMTSLKKFGALIMKVMIELLMYTLKTPSKVV